MTRFEQIFPKPNTFLVVAHVRSQMQAATSVKTARDNGADGVFLNNHSVHPKELVNIYKYIRKIHPDYFVGLYQSNVSTMAAIELAPFSVSGLLIDDAGIRVQMNSDERKHALSRYMNFQNEHYEALYFGGMSLRRQASFHEVRTLAANAVPYMDVTALSGIHPWNTPGLGLVQQVRAVSSDHPLAVMHDASEETNISSHLPYADCTIVSKGLGTPGRFTDLSPISVRNYADGQEIRYCKHRLEPSLQ